MMNAWHNDWIQGDFEIGLDSNAVYRIGSPSAPDVEIRLGDRPMSATSSGSILLPPDRELRVEGRHLRKRIIDERGRVASISTRSLIVSVVERMISGGFSMAGRSLAIETCGAVFRLDRFDKSRPKVEIFVPKRSVIHTKGVMADETGSQVLVVDKVYTKERIGFTFGGRRMRGWFEGSVTARSPVPTLAALLALHIVLRPESYLRTGEWKESGSAGG